MAFLTARSSSEESAAFFLRSSSGESTALFFLLSSDDSAAFFLFLSSGDSEVFFLLRSSGESAAVPSPSAPVERARLCLVTSTWLTTREQACVTTLRTLLPPVAKNVAPPCGV